MAENELKVKTNAPKLNTDMRAKNRL